MNAELILGVSIVRVMPQVASANLEWVDRSVIGLYESGTFDLVNKTLYLSPRKSPGPFGHFWYLFGTTDGFQGELLEGFNVEETVDNVVVNLPGLYSLLAAINIDQLLRVGTFLHKTICCRSVPEDLLAFCVPPMAASWFSWLTTESRPWQLDKSVHLFALHCISDTDI